MARSPDFASAFVLALMDTPRLPDLEELRRRQPSLTYDPYAAMRRGVTFDPYARGSRDYSPYRSPK